MYKFVDTNQATHSTPLPSEALNFNGQFLEKVILTIKHYQFQDEN